MTQRPIAEKYCEGKLKRMSKDESKELETVPREQKEEVDEGACFTHADSTSGKGRRRRKVPVGDPFAGVATRVLKLAPRLEEQRGAHRGSGGTLVPSVV